MKTTILYFDQPERTQNEATILNCSKDEQGYFVTVSESCYFSGGGGQQADAGQLFIEDDVYKIKNGNFEGAVQKLYIDCEKQFSAGTAIQIQIDKESRLLNSKLHSAGHLISSVIFEQLGLDLIPVKGYHYPEGSHVEFSSSSGLKTIDIEQINRVLIEKVLEKLTVSSKVVKSDSEDFLKSFKVSGFSPAADSEIRLVEIDGFLAYACGGTHVAHTGLLDKLKVTGLKSKKGNLRVKYEI